MNIRPPMGSYLLSLILVGCAADKGPQGSDSDQGDDDDASASDPAAACTSEKLAHRQLRRLTGDQLEITLSDAFPEITNDWNGAELGPDPVAPGGFANDASYLLVNEQVAREWLATAESVAGLIIDPLYLPDILPCAVQSADRACAQSYLSERGSRLFHRPLSADEVSSYLTHFESIETEGGFEMALKWTTVALMMSPHATYRFELGTQIEGDYQLDPYELATQLAFTYSGGPPSPQLIAQAESGTFDDPQARIDQARALLDTDRGQAQLHRLLAQWSGYPRIAGRVKNDLPAFESAREAMQDETRAFLQEVVVHRSGGIQELLTAPYTVLSQELVDYYGYGEAGQDPSPRPEQWGVGLLAQGSMLAGLAHADSSSPTQRGLFIYERLFCNVRPVPPPDIPSIEPPEPGARTTRERYEDSHVAQPCAGCHDLFDPLGFGLEHFDASGRYRADEAGLAIDASGDLSSPIQGKSEELSFNGINELAQTLADTPGVGRCIADQVSAFTFGGTDLDPCIAGPAREGVVSGELGLADYFAHLAGSANFIRRQP